MAGLGRLIFGGGGHVARADENGSDDEVTGETTLEELIGNPAFGEGGYSLLPWYGTHEDLSTTIAEVGDYMPYHNYFDVPAMVDPLNRLVADAFGGKQVFYRIYSEQECIEEPDRVDVGLFFFRGRGDAPFAVVCPGGGFAYVGSLHESLPHCLALSNLGYNTFSLSYRTGSGDLAAEDLARALTYIFDNAGELGVSTEGYSLWGSSAGARMAAAVGSYGAEAFGGARLPRPSTVVMAYTGQSNYTEQDPPTFAVVGSRDGIASPTVMRSRIEGLQSAGVSAQIEVFDGLRHGFGVGTGTVAQGWVDDAVAFWEEHGPAGQESWRW